MYVWLDAAALELPKGSNERFKLILDNKLAITYSSGKTERGSDSSENRGVLKNTTPYAKLLENSIQKTIQNPKWRYEVDFNIPEGDLCDFPRTPIKFFRTERTPLKIKMSHFLLHKWSSHKKYLSWQSHILKIIILQDENQVNHIDDALNELLKAIANFEGKQVEIVKKIKEVNIPGRSIQVQLREQERMMSKQNSND